MDLRKVQALKIQYLRTLYKEVNKISSNIYSVLIDPYQLGQLLNLDKNTTERIVMELVEDSLLNSSLGMGTISLNRNSTEHLRIIQSREAVNESFKAYYISREEYIDLLQSNKVYAASYVCYIRLYVKGEFTSESFNCTIALRKNNGSEYYFIDQSNSSQIGIVRDYQKQESGFFTFDGSIFYQIDLMKVNSNGIFEFILKRNHPMRKDDHLPNNVNITNSPNTSIQIQQNSPNSIQNIKNDLQLSEIRQLAKELRDNFESITKQLSTENQTRLIVAVEYLEEIITEKESDLDQAPKHIRKIKEVLNQVPVELVSSFLSDQVVGLLSM